MNPWSETQFRNTNGMILPNEILVKIFNYLDLPSKRNCRLACDLWRSILDVPRICGVVFKARIYNTPSINALFNSLESFDTVRIEYMDRPLPSITLSRNKFPRIKHAEIGLRNSGSNVLKFLRYGCQKAASLLIDEMSLGSVSTYHMTLAASSMKFENLVMLELRIEWKTHAYFLGWTEGMIFGWKHCHAVQALLRVAHMPNLASFSFEYINCISSLLGEDDLPVLGDLLADYYQFIKRHVQKLRLLHLTTIRVPNLSEGTAYEIRIPEDKFSLQEAKYIRENLKLAICLISSDKPTYIIVLPSIDCETLSSFSCQFLGVWTAEQTNWLKNVIFRNQKTLVHLDIGKDLDFDMSFLKNCTSLRTLQIRSVHIHNTEDVMIPSLIFIEVYPDSDYVTGSFDKCVWIIQNCRNIEIIKFSGVVFLDVSVPLLKMMFSLPNFKQFTYTVYLQVGMMPDPRDFCSSNSGFVYKEQRMETTTLPVPVWTKSISRV